MSCEPAHEKNLPEARQRGVQGSKAPGPINGRKVQMIRGIFRGRHKVDGQIPSKRGGVYL